MIVRVRSRGGDGRVGDNYFTDPSTAFVSSGCAVLDCVLSGGWPLGRVANIVGDKAVGKTLLAIEACTNFHRQFPEGHIWYREAEGAFDVPYAEQLGLPTSAVDFGPEGVDSDWETVEDIFEDLGEQLTAIEKDLQKRLARVKDPKKQAAERLRRPGIYIVDSLDALSSRTELKRAIDKGSYGTDKAAVMSELFRRYRKRLKRANVLVIFVSQLRDAIGVMFGEKQKRTGGRALDFYASQVLWLHHKERLSGGSGKVERVVAVRIRAKCKKNKVGPAFRECGFVIRFNYGIDDMEASLSWLKEAGMLDRIGIKVDDAKEQDAAISKMLRANAKMGSSDARAQVHNLARIVRECWDEVEDRFRPTRRKYE